MFWKLLKYDFKRSFAMMTFLSLAVLGLGGLGAADLQILVRYGDVLSAEDSPHTMVLFGLVMLLVFLVLALLAYAWGSQLLLKYRFYKHNFTDEGYMVFTLSASGHTVFLAWLANMVLWWLVSLAVIAGTVSIVLNNGLCIKGWYDTRLMEWVIPAWQAAKAWYQELTGSQDLTAYLAAEAVIGSLYNMVFPMTAVVIGATLAKKHKLLAAFFVYYGIFLLLGAVNVAVSSLVALDALTIQADAAAVMLQRLLLVQMGFQIVVIISGYLLSTHLLKKKLNLP